MERLRMKRNLKDKLVVVTGASGNLGRALVTGLLQKQARVMAVDVDSQGLKDLTMEVQSSLVQTMVMDLMQASSQQAWEEIRSLEPDGIILNAGITRIAPFAETSEQDFRSIFEVNFFSSVGALHALLPGLQVKRGFVAAVSSVSGFAPLKFRSAYSPSKHAISALMDTLRTEVTGVDFTIAYPSFLSTEVKSSSKQASRSARGSLSPQDVAAAIVSGVERRKPRLLLPFQAKLARLLWALWPSRFLRMMEKRA
ncbi:MAG: SDR family NAD(P)-dependent oxidoreductase [Leptospiraceae bacterium]|nr:SDR family NAD(P)-dependent oxidoreductase [Leptospiraceae bacterium]MCB1171236.1 SDR family NAD(P)-dependent oxidoreductase [Leptospiraceae bacterium]